MSLLTTISSLRSLQSTLFLGRSVGFVPTMGSLHAGHLALVKSSKQKNDFTVCSVFVNPTQFGPNEDFHKYPRDLNNDIKLLKTEKCDFVFAPSLEEMYGGIQNNRNTVVKVDTTRSRESESRPGHFEGVATVVTKLVNIVKPTSCYFGQKDAMQCSIVIEPTLREKDGLAMSSRNVYLTSEERAYAGVLHRSLLKGALLFERGERNVGIIKNVVESVLTRNSLPDGVFQKIEYISVMDECGSETPDNLNWPENGILSIAVKIGKTRLIDNIPLPTPANMRLREPPY